MLDALDPDWRALEPLRELRSGRPIERGWCLETDLGRLVLEAYAPEVFRLRIGEPARSDYGLLAGEPAVPEVERAELAGSFTVVCGGCSLGLGTDPTHLWLQRGGERILESTGDAHFVRPQRLPALARSGGGWFLALALASGERIYGLGEKWGPLDRRGQLVVSRDEDALGVNSERSYKNCPFAWSPRGWGVLVHTPAVVRHGVGFPQWSHRSYGIELDDPHLDLFLIAADGPAQILERYTALTGRMPMPPLWSLGVWLSRAFYRDAEDLLEVARTARERCVPCDVIVLDGRAWLDTRTRFAFEWDAARYPEPARVTEQIHALGLRLCCWEYPLVSVQHPLFGRMAGRRWLLGDAGTGGTYVDTSGGGRAQGESAYRHRWDPEPFGPVLTPLPDSGLVDFTHPEAYAFWRDSHRALFESGIDCIKSDFGEQVPDEAVAWNGDRGRRLHNVYPLLYNRCVFEATEAHTGDGIVMGRAGWIGSQRYPIQWGGDPQSDWEGLAASLRGALSWGLSGAPCYATDIGGFYGAQPDAELFVRWTQAALFGSHMRFHGIGPREPWSFGAQAESIVRDLLEWRYRLIPYLLGTLRQAAASGLPVMRAMVLAFPGDPASWAFDDQFMFGPDLLVAPVLTPGGSRRCYLPEGAWFDLWSGQPVAGGRVLSELVPLDRIPVYARGGSILALGPAVQSTRELEGHPGAEALRVFGLPERLPCLPGGGLRLERLETGGVRIHGAEGLRVEAFGTRLRRTAGGLELGPA